MSDSPPMKSGEGFVEVASSVGETQISRLRSTGATLPPQALAKVVPQVIDAIARFAPGEVEIALNPEELGSLRLRMQTSDGGMLVVISAERIETQELIRRSIDILAQDLKDIGFDDIAFHFADRDPTHDPLLTSADDDAVSNTEDAGEAGIVIHETRSALDIRV